MKNPVRALLFTALFALAAVLTWAFFVPLDAGIPAPGVVVVDGKRKAVAHERGGVVREVFVQEGDRVEAGEPLIQLQDDAARAAYVDSKAQLRATNSHITGLEEKLESLRPLTEDGFYPRNQLIELERQLGEHYARRESLKAKEQAVFTELGRTVIVSPVSGRVMSLTANVAGLVIAPNTKILDVIPDEPQVVIEARVPTHLIDHVDTGASVQIRFSALHAPQTPIIYGSLHWVSADRFEPENGTADGPPFYLARVVVSDEELKKTNGFRVMPGMPAEVIIKTGSRTLAQYLIKPLRDRLAKAVREP
jgi:membrane fusion protein, protease secretion system